MNEYRIRRSDPRNLVIERLTDPGHQRSGGAPTWRVYGYYGNDLVSLAHGLMSLAASDHHPTGDDLLQQIDALRQAVTEGLGQLLTMLESGKISLA